MREDLFDLKAGRELRDNGILQAVEHADSVDEGWSDKAWRLFLAYLSTGVCEFMTEDVRNYAHNVKGFIHPPDDRAWGALIIKAVRERYIKKAGYAPMKSRNCHANPKAVWSVLTREG